MTNDATVVAASAPPPPMPSTAPIEKHAEEDPQEGPSSRKTVLPRLYLGSLRDAVDEHQLEKYDIRHVVSVHDLTPVVVPSQARIISYLRIRLSDSATADIASHFAETNAYIHSKRMDPKGGSVLVHCLAGVSRSATVVAAYLMVAAEMKPVARVLGHLSARRPCVNPNLGFRLQLAKYEKGGVSKDADALRALHPDRKRFDELKKMDMETLKLKRKSDLSRVGDWRRLFRSSDSRKESLKQPPVGLRRSSEGSEMQRVKADIKKRQEEAEGEERKELKRSLTASSAFVDALKNVSFIDEL